MMALLCSQAALNICRWIFLLVRLRDFSKNTVLNTLEPLLFVPSDSKNWRQLMLLLGYAAEFPMLVVLHPLVPQHLEGKATQLPSAEDVLVQIVILLLTDMLVTKIFTELVPPYLKDEETPASQIATDYLILRVTLHLAIGIVQSSRIIGTSSPWGDLHFVAVIIWLLIQQPYRKTYRQDMHPASDARIR